MIRCGSMRSQPWSSGLGGAPHLVHAVAGLVAGLGVLDPEIQRFALVGQLHAAVVALHGAVVTARRGAFGLQSGPVGGAGAVADGLAAARCVAVEGVERHAVGADQNTVLHLDLGLWHGLAAG